MLVNFSFDNFKSFKDETSFDMNATKDSEMAYKVAEISEERILKLAAIYGVNAGGKSNMIKALALMASLVKESANTVNSFFVPQKIIFAGDLVPFMLSSENPNKPIRFEVVFTDPDEDSGQLYRYGFSIKDGLVLEEWFDLKARTAREFKTILRRENNDLEIRGTNSRYVKYQLENLMTDKSLVISHAGKLKMDPLSKPYKFFQNTCFIDYERIDEASLINETILSEGPKKLGSELERASKFLRSFDRSIERLVIDNNFLGNATLYSVHVNDEGNEVRFPFGYESAGIHKMLSLYTYVSNVIRNGAILIVDELDSKLHPILLRSLLIDFGDPEINKKNAQLIFTIHDPWILSYETLRRDEIWFVDKKKDGSSQLYSLADIREKNGAGIRKDENFAKNYMLGKYGAIPDVEPFSYWDEDSDSER